MGKTGRHFVVSLVRIFVDIFTLEYFPDSGLSFGVKSCLVACILGKLTSPVSEMSVGLLFRYQRGGESREQSRAATIFTVLFQCCITVDTLSGDSDFICYFSTFFPIFGRIFHASDTPALGCMISQIHTPSHTTTTLQYNTLSSNYEHSQHGERGLGIACSGVRAVC